MPNIASIHDNLNFILLVTLSCDVRVCSKDGIFFKRNLNQPLSIAPFGPEWKDIELGQCTLQCINQYKFCSSFIYRKDMRLCIPGSCRVNASIESQVPSGSMYYNPVVCERLHACIQMQEGNVTTCVWVIGSRLPYIQAKEGCNSFHGHLYTIKVNEKLNFLNKINLLPKEYWIGLDDMDGENVLRWVDDDDIISQEQRASLFKSNPTVNKVPGKDCVLFNQSTQLLSDDDCSEAKPYICELN